LEGYNSFIEFSENWHGIRNYIEAIGYAWAYNNIGHMDFLFNSCRAVAEEFALLYKFG
jgi:hypothetical protein